MKQQHTEGPTNAAEQRARCAGGQAAGVAGHHAIKNTKNARLVGEAIGAAHAKQVASAASRAESSGRAPPRSQPVQPRRPSPGLDLAAESRSRTISS